MSKKPKMPRVASADRPKGRRDTTRYLNAALKTGDAGTIVGAVQTVIRAKGSAHIAKKAGVSKQDLAALFSDEGRSQLAPIFEMIRAAGLKLRVKPSAA